MAAHILLAGYLGCGNLGDDAMMLGFVHGLAGCPVHVSVLSGAPEETYRLYSFPSVPRRDMKLVEEAIDKCDALVFPGGSIFQDVTSVRSVAYYANLVKHAKSRGKKVLLLGQGIGPLNSFFGKRFATAALQSADALTVRDPQSLQTLQQLGVRRPVKVTADCAFLLPTPPDDPDVKNFSVGNMKSVGISVRPIGKGADVAGLFAEFCRLLYQSGTVPVLLEMDRNEDGPLIEEISKRQGGRIPHMRKLSMPRDVQQRMDRMEAVIAMRLHAGILATTVGVPALMVSYDPKVAAFSRMLGIGNALSIEGLTPQRMLEAFTSFYRDRERNGKLIEKKREELSMLAAENVQVVIDMLRTTAKI